MSEIERREHNESEPKEGEPYLFLALGIGLIIATVMIVMTTGAAITGFPFVLGAAVMFGLGANEMRKQRSPLPKPASKERELLSAIRDNGGSITPAEAAMETSLTVREADKMLSELAGGGHVAVESMGGALFYSLPSREDRALEGRG